MKTKRDKYDREIAVLKRNPKLIIEHWTYATPLFAYLTRSSGCLTQIRNGLPGPTPKITREIRSDKRIPKLPKGITIKSLPVFAEWQRRIDRNK